MADEMLVEGDPDSLTRDQVAEIDRDVQRFGSANCWTGTLGSLAGKARALVKALRLSWRHAASLDDQLAKAIRERDEALRKLAQRVPHKSIECKMLETTLETERGNVARERLALDEARKALNEARRDAERLRERLSMAEAAKAATEDRLDYALARLNALRAAAANTSGAVLITPQLGKVRLSPDPADHSPGWERADIAPAAPGTTAKFGTGAVRSSEVEEFRFDLVSPIGLREIARTCAEGAKKYSDFNWEKGMPVHDLLNHALAHIYRFLSGDRTEPHLPHAGWNVLAAIHSLELWPHLNAGTLRGPGCVPPAPVSRPAETRASGGTAQPSTGAG